MSDAASRPYAVISTDAHAGADLLDYKPYLERRFHGEFDAWAATFTDPWSDYDIEMVDTDDEFLRIGGASFLAPYNWESEKRLAHMDSEGIAAEVLFPNTVPPFYPSGVITAPAPSPDEYAHRWAGLRAHNRWLVDFCAAAPGRRAGLAQVFLTNVDDAIAEVRWAREAGLAGVLIPGDHHSKLVNLYEPRLDPFWAACSELRMPVHRHSLMVSPPENAEAGIGAPAIGLHEGMWFAHRGLSHLILGGVFERHADLQVVFTESFCSWVPTELQAIEGLWRSALVRGSTSYPFAHHAAEALTRTPSEYFQRNCWLGASLMVAADVEARHDIGIDRIMWGADYPHHEGTWPHTLLALRTNFADVPEDEVRAMTSLNAARLYGFNLDYLQTVADRIGPTVEEVATPVSLDELPVNTFCTTLSDAQYRLSALVAEEERL
jgi:predicted TIM-barrel fold metal-dependent hydrolase